MPHRTVCMHYMRVTAAVSEVVWLTILATKSHDIVNDTMILSCNGTKASLGGAYTLHSLYKLLVMSGHRGQHWDHFVCTQP